MTGHAEFVFGAEDMSDIHDPERKFTLTPEDFALLNPNTRTCPVFRSRRAAELTKAVYRRVPVLLARGQPDRNPWEVRFATMFHMANDSGLFRTPEELEAAGWTLDRNIYRRGEDTCLPLYEAKMMHHFTHRWGDYAMRPLGSLDSQLPDISSEQLADPGYLVQPRYWVAAAEVQERLKDWPHQWLVGFRDICRNTDERTAVISVLPRTAVGHNLSLLLSSSEHHLVGLLGPSLASFALDFFARVKAGGTHLSFFIVEQLPVLPPGTYEKATPWLPDITLADWLMPRILELTYTAWDLKGFAADLSYSGPPFRWDDERRALLRAELDACFFHLYGIERDDVDFIMETFPIVRRNDEAAYGDYRTKRLILEGFDAMAKATISGELYRTVLVPPPADPTVAPSSRS